MLSLEQGLDELATATKAALSREGLVKVGVPGFSGPDGDLRCVGAAGFYLADGLQKRLETGPAGRIQVQSRRSLGPVLRDAGLGVSDLAAETVPRAVRRAGVDALVIGKVARKPSHVEVDLRVVRVSDRMPVVTKVVRIDDNPTLLAYFGENVAVKRESMALGSLGSAEVSSGTRVPPSAGLAPSGVAVAGIMREAKDPNRTLPQLGNSPFGLELLVGGNPQPLRRNNDALYVAAHKGQAYQIRLTNRYAQRVGVVLLIDGLDTINPQGDTYRWGKPQLWQRPMWLVDPDGKVDVRGWQGRDSYEEFVFTDAAQSLAAQQQFTEHIGLITAVFFLESDPAKGGSVGTTTGRRVASGPVPEEAFHTDKEPVAILSLRYDSPEVVERYERVDTDSATPPAKP